MGDYIIKNITVKRGHLRELHECVLGQECIIADLEAGQRSLLRCKTTYCPDDYHRIHTSTVLGYTVSEDGNELTIETMNTVYHLVRCNFDDETFGGIKTYTMADARNTVVEFFKDKDDAYFEGFGTTRDDVLGDDELIERCALLHYNIAKDAGIDYAWACDAACGNVLSGRRAYANAE